MKVAISGAHGTGKTTLAYAKVKALKLANPTKTVALLQEVAAECPLPINRDATMQSQLWILGQQLKREIELAARFDILVCDRTVFDILAYTCHVDVRLGQDLFRALLPYARTYDIIYFKHLKGNDFPYNDGLRDTDPAFRRFIDECLASMYSVIRGLPSGPQIVDILTTQVVDPTVDFIDKEAL